MSKEKRILRREMRKQRREKMNTLLDLGKNIPDLPTTITADNYQQVFRSYWPFLKEAFSLIKALKITGQKTDDTMDELIKLGISIAENNDGDAKAKFQEKLSGIWSTIKTVFNLIMTFSPDKVDNVIDKIIEVGDWITGDKQEGGVLI
ncbi:MAG: hypothetical protein AB7P01_05120 [Bacteroidia bacterium]